MYVLLSVCLVLHPQRIDESLQSVLREKPHAERIVRMQKGELQVEFIVMKPCEEFFLVTNDSHRNLRMRSHLHHPNFCPRSLLLWKLRRQIIVASPSNSLPKSLWMRFNSS